MVLLISTKQILLRQDEKSLHTKNQESGERPAMHHYRCHNVYLLATASERIVDTLELFPHNYKMPQLFSTARLLMAAKDMTDAL
jgi:hypothetical protein